MAIPEPISAAGAKILDTWSPTAVILVMIVGGFIAGLFLALPAVRTDVKAERIEARADRAEDRIVFAAAAANIALLLKVNEEAIRASGDKAAQSMAAVADVAARMQETLARIDAATQEGLRQQQSMRNDVLPLAKR